jgi:hypothetical protein
MSRMSLLNLGAPPLSLVLAEVDEVAGQQHRAHLLQSEKPSDRRSHLPRDGMEINVTLILLGGGRRHRRSRT